MHKVRAYSGIAYHARCFPETVAVIDDFGSYTYKQLFSDALRVVSGFREAGLGPSDRVAIVSDNRYEAIVLILSGLLGGPVIVPVNRRVVADEILWIIGHAEAKVLVSDQEAMNELAALDNNISKRLLCKIFSSGLDTAEDQNKCFLEWISSFPEAQVPSVYEPNRPYIQVYTSGTSGKPKGVVLSEENCLGQLSSLLMCLDVSLTRGDRLYEGLPVFHIGGVMVSLLALSRGLSIRYMRSFNPTRLLDLICAKKIDHAALVPAMMQACQNTEHSPDLVRGLRTILYGASPITETLLRNASERYRCEFFQIYGMTETHSVITVLGASEHLRMLSSESSLNIGSAGRPVPGSSLQIVDEAGAPVEKCIAGEIRVSSQHTMTGYWNDASATNESIRDGFLYTGDVGYVNEEGFLYIIDRIKDLIISGGENVSSLEVESALIAHAAIDDVAVIGTHDDRWGECVTAVVVRADDELNEKDVVEFGKSWLAGFKAPKRVIFVDSIPRNANGKILKKNLREGCYKEDIR